MQIFRIFDQLQILKRVLVNRFMKDAVQLHNFDKVLKSSLLAYICIHMFTCGWIWIGVSYSDSWLFTQQQHLSQH